MLIDDVMKHVCEFGASAIARYTHVSGEDVRDMPEYFIPAFIFHRLGDQLSMTLETTFTKLSEWNTNTRRRRALPDHEASDKAALLRLAEQLGQSRVDLVLYQGQERGTPKDAQDFMALIEVKKGWLDPKDHRKLRRILPHIDTCRYGATCGWVKQGNLQIWRDRVHSDGDRWYETPIPDRQGYYFIARLFENPNWIALDAPNSP